jgi:hypothetical protein
MNIPRVIHQIWLGREDSSPPSVMKVWIEGWSRLNPTWRVWMWREVLIEGVHWLRREGLSGHLGESGSEDSETVSGLPFQLIKPSSLHADLLRRACHISQRSNIWRYLVVERFGGLYIDTDVEPCRPIEKIVAPHEAFAAIRMYTYPLTIVESGFFGSVANHPWISDVVKGLSLKEPERSLSMGVELLTEVTRRHPEVAFLSANQIVFDPPTDWQAAKKEARVPTSGEGVRRYPEAYAVHHWSSLWHKDGFIQRGDK